MHTNSHKITIMNDYLDLLAIGVMIVNYSSITDTLKSKTTLIS